MKARLILTIALPLSAVVVYACGGDDTADVDGSADAPTGDVTQTSDTGANKDASNTSDASDAGTTNETGVTDGSASDVFVESSIGCTLPSDCPNEFCCGTIVFNGGALPHCDLKSASSDCAPTCKSNVALSCNATDTVRACAATADCADAGSALRQMLHGSLRRRVRHLLLEHELGRYRWWHVHVV